MANADPALEEVPNLNYVEDLIEEFYGPERLMDQQYGEEEYNDEEGYYDDERDAGEGAVPHIVGDYTQLGAVPRESNPDLSSSAPPNATTAAEFASSSEEGASLGGPSHTLKVRSDPVGPMDRAGAVERPETSPSHPVTNPDGSLRDEETFLEDELHRVQRKIANRRLDRKRRLEQELAAAKQQLQAEAEEEEEALRRLARESQE